MRGGHVIRKGWYGNGDRFFFKVPVERFPRLLMCQLSLVGRYKKRGGGGSEKYIYKVWGRAGLLSCVCVWVGGCWGRLRGVCYQPGIAR